MKQAAEDRKRSDEDRKEAKRDRKLISMLIRRSFRQGDKIIDSLKRIEKQLKIISNGQTGH